MSATPRPSPRRHLNEVARQAPSVSVLEPLFEQRPELESSVPGLATLLRPGERAPVDALYSYWIDRHNGYIDDPGLLACALLRTAELLAGHDPSAGWTVDEGEALSRCARALAGSRDEHGLASAFAELWLDELTAMMARVGQLREPSLDWIELLNTAVALWPARIDEALEPLAHPTSASWRAWLQYLSVLAYPVADHPWWSTSIVLWARFGEEFGLRWTAAEIAALEATLADDRVRAGLERLASREFEDEDEGAEVERVREEIAVLQLDRDLPRRRTALARKLVAEAPAPYWDDEYGG